LPSSKEEASEPKEDGKDLISLSFFASWFLFYCLGHMKCKTVLHLYAWGSSGAIFSVGCCGSVNSCIKLIGYGEDDEALVENVMNKTRANNFHSSLHSNGKVFWVAP
jgi:hypothetical protein